MIYAGIGSRETPPSVLEDMISVGHHLANIGWTLRSGGAGGADTAFEEGCDRGNGSKEIFIPWNNFSGRNSNQRGVIARINCEAEAIAQRFHPNWNACSRGARALHSRNVAQILGQHLNQPSDLVICWTKNASGAGGTGQALRMAKHYNIPIFDLGNPANYDHLTDFVQKIRGE